MKDLTGQRFGRLVAVEPTDKRKDQLVVWRCRCDCGREVEVVGSALTKGNTRSCGCLLRETATRDITGQRFGRLVALAPTDKRVRQSVVWRCECDCGNIREVPLSMLRSGQVKSCGCLRAESHAKDLAGRRFGRLVALRPVGTRNRYVLWECQCDCGNLKEATSQQLLAGKTRSCGCLRREATAGGNRPRDLVGQRFGRLVVRERAGTRRRSPLWLCRCDCGNAVEATSAELRRGEVRSCGCLPAGADDLAGRRFGQLVAVNPAGATDDGDIVWRCLCDCGAVAHVPAHALTSGTTTTCATCATHPDINEFEESDLESSNVSMRYNR